MKLILGAALVCLFAYSEAAAQWPSGWRYPVEADYKDDWKHFRKELPVPFHVRADFDGDGTQDDAWLLIRKRGEAYGLFVFMGRHGGKARVLKLVEGEGPPQRMGIDSREPGRYKTACGKGYFECGPGERPILRLSRVGLAFFVYESAETIYYWDRRRRLFQPVRISV